MTDHWLEDIPEGTPRASLLLAHGAGAPMDSDFMNRMAALLCERGIAVRRFEFPYMAQRRQGGRRPPDRQPVLLDCWRQQLARWQSERGGPVFIGGKSLGGRMASLLLAEERTRDVAGLVCLGYPFHPPGKPERTRTEHLAGLRTPTLIAQGSRDPLGNRQEVAAYTLSDAIVLHWLEDGDHDFRPRVKSGFTVSQHLVAAAEAATTFMIRHTPGSTNS